MINRHVTPPVIGLPSQGEGRGQLGDWSRVSVANLARVVMLYYITILLTYHSYSPPSIGCLCNASAASSKLIAAWLIDLTRKSNFA